MSFGVFNFDFRTAISRAFDTILNAFRVTLIGGVGTATSFTKEHVNVTNAPQEFLPAAGQISIRFVPNGAGTFAYGPDNSVSTTNSETFNQTSPIEIETSSSVFLIRSAATATVNMVVYRFIKT